MRRPPHGGRGLKFLKHFILVVDFQSSPSRGTWIEINRGFTWNWDERVVPLTGDVD